MKKLTSVEELIELVRKTEVGPLPDTFFAANIRTRLQQPAQIAIELDWVRVAAAFLLFAINTAVWYVGFEQNFSQERYYNLSDFFSVNSLNF
ncbi:MAG: hypothetical protein ACKOE6_08650 [Flammeovirgaceae bacterium]